ncbi:hypothetical protein ACGFMM_26480 [Streptomyces sp. NPDC048604]|uniref:hypothetical protein n=1 Tax=Streptomyces sp. NPDC048604 TaxID=3365578 RepID=UPI003715573E
MVLTSAAALLSVGLVAGCSTEEKPEVPSGGGKPSAGASSQKGPGTGEPDADALKFVRCLRENGLKVDDPESNGNVSIQVTETQDQAKIDKAQKACKQYADQGGSGGAADGPESEEAKTWRLKVEACMRKQGFEMGNVKPGQEKKHETATRACYQEAGPVPGQGGQ